MRSALYWRVNYTYLHGNDRSSLLLYLSDGFFKRGKLGCFITIWFCTFHFSWLYLAEFCFNFVCVPSRIDRHSVPAMNRNLMQFLLESPASIWLTVGIKNIAKRLKKGIAFVRINPMFRLMLPNVICISNVLSKYFHNLLLWKSNGHRKKKETDRPDCQSTASFEFIEIQRKLKRWITFYFLPLRDIDSLSWVARTVLVGHSEYFIITNINNITALAGSDKCCQSRFTHPSF